MASLRHSIPLADAPLLARVGLRTIALRIGLALAVVGLLTASVLLARGLQTRPTSYFARGGGGIAVVDFSLSIDPRAYARMARVLETFANTDQRLGLIAFSDRAYEMLPPGTRGDELRPLLRFFEQREARARSLAKLPPNPWSTTFRGGTRISQGLALARETLQRRGADSGSVVLISDLENASSDLSLMEQEVSRYRRSGIQLKIVPLFPSLERREIFRRIVGRDAILDRADLLRNSAVEERQTVVGSFPAWLAGASILLLLLLAVNEHFCRRLTWRRA